MNRREALHHIGAAAAGWMASTSPQGSTETIIRGGRVVNADGSRVADLRLSGELIAEIGPSLDIPAGAHVVDACEFVMLTGKQVGQFGG